MTEREWLSRSRPGPMLGYCVRRGMPPGRFRRFAEACCLVYGANPHVDLFGLPSSPEVAAWAMVWVRCVPNTASFAIDQARIAGIIRDIFGNPFRPPAVDWMTPEAALLAVAADGDALAGVLAPDRLKVLADCVEEAGCDDADILAHLRGLERCPRCLGAGRVDRRLAPSGPRASRRGYTSALTDCGDCAATGWIPKRDPCVRGCCVVDLIAGEGR